MKPGEASTVVLRSTPIFEIAFVDQFVESTFEEHVEPAKDDRDFALAAKREQLVRFCVRLYRRLHTEHVDELVRAQVIS